MATKDSPFESIFTSSGLVIDTERKKEFYKKYNDFKDEVPFNIIRFARELGINLYTSKDFSDTQSGKIEYDSVSKNYSVSVNANHSANRIMFTLAHEIGHYFCDGDYLEKNSYILSLNRGISPEDKDLIKRKVRANKFAAEILMPEKKFVEIWNASKTMEEVANKFRVSPEAVKYRALNVIGVIL